ncbi:Symplekin/Pta1-like protein [Dorcoceras hygrometricum]|uniref:Symplekin/Pta1-like protein n=1 Tax=Dorcoceras hygrometricum TaxID=472368 RepID=A0A2Z7AAJ4_9LAMI|nr:Symplekin/Pta1-like protein [Dorcoceras hygrometricum]
MSRITQSNATPIDLAMSRITQSNATPIDLAMSRITQSNATPIDLATLTVEESAHIVFDETSFKSNSAASLHDLCTRLESTSLEESDDDVSQQRFTADEQPVVATRQTITQQDLTAAGANAIPTDLATSRITQTNGIPTDLDTSRITQTNATPTDLATSRIMQSNATPTDLATANATADTSTANATVSNIPTTNDEAVNSTHTQQQELQLESDTRSNNDNHQVASEDPNIFIQSATQGEQGANHVGLDLRWNKNHPPEQVIATLTSAVGHLLMKNSFSYVSTTVGRLSIKKTALLTSSSRNMFRGNSDACVSITDEILPTKKTALLTSSSSHMLRGNSDACVSATVAKPSIKPTALLTHSLHSQMASSFITNSYQINFESVLMIHDNEGMLNMFKALEASGLRQFLGLLFDVLKDMVDRTQKKAKGFAAQIGVLLKSFHAIPMGDGVPFPSAKVLSMRTVHTYVVTNTTIDARTESEEPGMAKTPKGKKKHSSADEMPVDMFAEFTASKKRSATEADAPIIAKKRRTGKSKPSVSQAKLDIVQVAADVEPIQIVDPSHAAATEPSHVLNRKSRKRKLVLSRNSDDESLGTEETIKEADSAVALSSVEADIAKVLEETLALGVTETEQESQVFDEALFEEDFTRWLDDFVARHNEPELGSTNNGAQTGGSTNSVADKEINMPIDDLLVQICDVPVLPVTAAEVTMLRLGAFSSPGEKGKAKLGEDDQVTDNAARKLFALICRDVEVLVQVRDRLMQAVVDFFASFTLNSMPDMDSLKDLKEKERLMLAWAETTTLAIAVRRQLYVLIKYRELLLRTILESYQRYLTHDLPWNAMAIQVANLLSVAHSHSTHDGNFRRKSCTGEEAHHRDWTSDKCRRGCCKSYGS